MRLTTQPRPIPTEVDANFNPVAADLGSERLRILRYLMVGAVGFLVDAGLLGVQVHLLRIGPFVARAPSFLTAATVTWLLNRKHTFKDLARHSTGTEFRRYIMSQVAGALANLAVYATAIASIPWCAKYPVAALAFGAVLGLVVNYSLARFYVFPGSRP